MATTLTWALEADDGLGALMTAQLGISILASGPLFGRHSTGSFQHGGTVATPAAFALDGAKPAFDRSISKSVEELARLGTVRLFQQGQSRPGGVFLSVEEARPGHASTGRWRATLHVSVGQMNATITNPSTYNFWLEGVSSRNDTTRFKGYGLFRRTETYLEEEAPRVVERFANEAVSLLNG
jgi:hypothetical protein